MGAGRAARRCKRGSRCCPGEGCNFGFENGRIEVGPPFERWTLFLGPHYFLENPSPVSATFERLDPLHGIDVFHFEEVCTNRNLLQRMRGFWCICFMTISFPAVFQPKCFFCRSKFAASGFRRRRFRLNQSFLPRRRAADLPRTPVLWSLAFVHRATSPALGDRSLTHAKASCRAQTARGRGLCTGNPPKTPSKKP